MTVQLQARIALPSRAPLPYVLPSVGLPSPPSSENVVQEHNFVAILVAAVVGFMIGGVWYSPLMFSRRWAAAHGFTSEQLVAMKADAPKAYGLSFVAMIVMAAVLSLILNHIGAHDLRSGALWGAHIWLGFAATIGLMANLYTGKKFSVFLIDTGYQLVYLVVMGAILGAWH
jgi:hypothetical protein